MGVVAMTAIGVTDAVLGEGMSPLSQGARGAGAERRALESRLIFSSVVFLVPRRTGRLTRDAGTAYPSPHGDPTDGETPRADRARDP